MDLSFYRNKTVLVTGHTGFKGTWMCEVLKRQGAKVIGYALSAPTEPSLFELTNMAEGMVSVTGDIRDLPHLNEVFDAYLPEVVIHMAAQPIVRESYVNPVYTYEANVMGTVNILECVRTHPCVRSFVNVTTDKVYLNREWHWGYRENEELNGYDPYSNSKSCSELVTDSYQRSFLSEHGVAVSTARAGNVIGGGDFSVDRIIPDCIRAVQAGTAIQIRNPFSVRPYQHVLEPLSAYLLIAQRQYEDRSLSGSYNVGPDNYDCITTGRLAELFCAEWGPSVRWEHVGQNGPHEDQILRLDCSKITSVLGWHPRWDVRRAVKAVVEWTKVWLADNDAAGCMERQIQAFLQENRNYYETSY